MDEMQMLFSSLDEGEMEELLSGIEEEVNARISEDIKKRLGIAEKKKSVKAVIKYILPVAAALCFVVAGAVVFSLNSTKKPEVSTEPSVVTTETLKPVDNPLMLAISSGDDDLIARLLSLPGLISRETLEFALSFSDLLSYETLHEIALSAKENLGATGLDGLLESSIFGDSARALDELRKRDTMLMTPFERLSFFFAVAFCDSEVVDEYINRGYDINITDSQGNSIYAIAEKYGNEDNMKYAQSKGITY